MFWRIKRWWRWNRPVVYREGKHWNAIQQQRIDYGREVAETTWREAYKILEERRGTRRRKR